MLGKIGALPEDLGRPETLLADNGYFSEANVTLCTAANIEPLIALGREPHHQSWRERFAAAPSAPENPTPVEAMGLPSADAQRQTAIRPAQTDPGTGVRHHQIDARIPSIFAARARQGARRVEPCNHGLEHQTDVRPQPRLMRPGAGCCREKQTVARRHGRSQRDLDAIERPAKPCSAKIAHGVQPQPSVRQAARPLMMPCSDLGSAAKISAAAERR